MRHLLGIACTFLAVSACATPQPISVGDFNYSTSAKPVAASFSVSIDESVMGTDDQESVYNEWQYVTDVTEPHLAEILRDDLEEILGAHTQSEQAGNNAIHVDVKIMSAEVAYRHFVLEVLPFTGIATAARQRDFRTEAEIELTVLDGSRALRSTQYDPTVYTRNNAATRATIAQGVVSGVEALREELKSTFVEDVIARYVWE